jgi:hypothetical protein
LRGTQRKNEGQRKEECSLVPLDAIAKSDAQQPISSCDEIFYFVSELLVFSAP